MSEPSAWLYSGGEDEDFASVKRWPAGVIRAQGWTEEPLYTREAIEAEIVAWLRNEASKAFPENESDQDPMATVMAYTFGYAQAIERGEYRSKSDG